MGSSFKKMFRRKSKEVVIAGLDGAGKTTLLYRIKQPNQEIETIIPTIGMYIEKLNYRNLNLSSFDVGQAYFLKEYLSASIDKADGLIFVVDSSDMERIDEAAQAFNQLLANQKVQHLPILILANKVDNAKIMSLKEIESKLLLNIHPILNSHMHGVSILKNEGINEALHWLCIYEKE